MIKEDFFYLGKIIKSHGFKGDWVVYFDFINLSILKDLKLLFIELENFKVPFPIESIRGLSNKNKFLIKFKSLTFEDLKGSDIYLPWESFPIEDKNKLYYYSLIGFLIKEIHKGDIGTIKGINKDSPQLLFIVEYHKKELLIPIVDPFIKEINEKEGFILMEFPLGLLEL